MAAPLLPRVLPLLRRRLLHRHYYFRLTNPLVAHSYLCGTSVHSIGLDHKTPSLVRHFSSNTVEDPILSPQLEDQADFRQWKDKETEILKDIQPIVSLTKEILHSDRYKNGERLTPEDQKAIVDKLLAYHPHSDDKIGCGLDSIMVDWHPQFGRTRCLFVVRRDGGWIDFSYQKCLRAYIRDKYPLHAERFIKEHYKRGSG